jgi:pyruvate dehydrogenase (quinone)
MKINADVPEWIAPAAPVLRPGNADVEHLAGFLNAASRVTLFCGAGCAGAHAEVIELARKLKAPIVHAFRGKEFIEYDNPYDVGMTGLVGFASGYAAMKYCDALLMLGTDFPCQVPQDVPLIAGMNCSVSVVAGKETPATKHNQGIFNQLMSRLG